jgi:hypothetical protein
MPAVSNAQWAVTGTPISTVQNDQRVITMCSDGAGGAIIAWEDYRTDPGSDLYAQRLSATGVPQWTANGVVVCNVAPGSQYQPRMISDGAGGAIITWQDSRSGATSHVYAQRINGSGASLWTLNGILVTNVAGDQIVPVPVSDGIGGAIIAWYDSRTPANGFDIYVQKLNSAGVAQWTANGVAVCTAAFDQTIPQIASDGAQGAIIVWLDVRAGGGTAYDLYAQRVVVNGSMLWTANGVAVCTANNIQNAAAIVSDGANGAIIGWQDFRSGTNYDIYTQRLSGAGAPLWTANGFGVCTMGNDQFSATLIPDGSQGAFFAWTDQRDISTNSNDVYAHHVGSAGNVLWPNQGLKVSALTNVQQDPHLTSDGANGVIVVWADGRTPADQGLYAQRLDNNGTPYWTTDGVRETNYNFGYSYQPTTIADSNGNVIVGWYAYPAYPTEANVYATRIDARFGYWGKPDPTLFAVKDVPNDQGGKVRVEWYASSRDQLNQQTITKYTIWRGIDQAMYATAVAAGVPEVKITDPASSFNGKVVRHDKAQAVDYFWELIGTQTAAYRVAYAFTAATSFDSTATNSATHRFQVLAHATGDLINWPSNVLSGRSVDNLAPPAPLFLTAQRIGNYVYLKWNGVHVPDLDKYTVYRKTSTGVTPVPPNFLANDNDTLLTDSSAPASALYYIVTATDIHQNQGAKSNEAAVTAATGVGNLPPVTALTVLQNHPNPFTSETELMVGLPAKSDIRVEIYDVAGRRVRETLLANQASGWRSLRIDSRDDRGQSLASGVYFYRVHAGGETVTKKMVIAR